MTAIGSKLGIDATKKIPGEGFKRPWPPSIKMDAALKAKMERLFKPVAADELAEETFPANSHTQVER